MTDQQPILDEQVIDELRASVGGDDAFIAELAATYVTEGTDQMGQIEAAAADGDVAGIVRPAHSLKSSSASLGAARMAQLSREMELAASDGRAEAIGRLVSDARAAWEETVKALTARGLVR